MKIVLLNPPQTYPKEFYGPSDFRLSMPLGLLYIAAVLEKNGFDNIEIVDSFSLGDKLDISVNGKYIQFGASWKEIERCLRGIKPDVVGISNTFTTQMGNAIKAAEIAKEIDPDILTIVGGAHASIRPRDFFEKTSAIDIAIMGEGERTIPEVMEYVIGKRQLECISGIAYRKGKGFKINPSRGFINDLDSLPYPAYHLIDLEKYFRMFKQTAKSRPYIKSERYMSVITSRGCPFNCIFCSIHLHMGKMWRAHSPEYILNHLQFLVDKYKIRHVCFEDDNLTLDKKRFEAILDGIVERGIKITWDTPNGVRADGLDRNLVIKAKRTGCTRVVVGVESGDQMILDKVIEKVLDLNKVIELAKTCKEIGINMHTFFVVGLPGEKMENIENTFKFAWLLMEKYDVIPSFNIAAPLIGTRLYKICKENGYLLKEATPENLQLGIHFQADGGMIKTDDFTPDYLSASIREFFKRMTLYQIRRPRYIIKMLRQDPKEFFYKAGRLINKAASNKIK